MSKKKHKKRDKVPYLPAGFRWPGLFISPDEVPATPEVTIDESRALVIRLNGEDTDTLIECLRYSGEDGGDYAWAGELVGKIEGTIQKYIVDNNISVPVHETILPPPPVARETFQEFEARMEREGNP